MELGKKYSFLTRALHLSILTAALLCVFLVVTDPKKILQLYPYPGVAVHLFSDSVEPEGTSVVTWIDRGNSIYECKIGYGLQYPYCGIVIKYKSPESETYDWQDYYEFSDAQSIDLSGYDGISVSMEYSGPSNSLNFFLRNSEKLPGSYRDYDQVPYIHVDFVPTESGTFIDLAKMQVAKWWIDRFNPPQNMRQPKFEHVFEMGIDLPPLPAKGSHRFKLNRITATKSYFPRKQLFPVIAGLIGINLLILIIQGLLRYFSYRYREENETLRTTMVIDPLTKCFNRLGLETAIDRMFPLPGSSGVYVMILDLDHFKQINDALGHAVGDEVLRKVSMALSGELRSDDIFGRWGGEEFIIISKISRDNLNNLIARLMRSLQGVSIEGEPEARKVTMSVGVTEARAGEIFDDVFKRADEAMYQVKQSGRGNWKLV